MEARRTSKIRLLRLLHQKSKKQRAKKVVVETGDALRPSYAKQTTQGVQGKRSENCLTEVTAHT